MSDQTLLSKTSGNESSEGELSEGMMSLSPPAQLFADDSPPPPPTGNGGSGNGGAAGGGGSGGGTVQMKADAGGGGGANNGNTFSPPPFALTASTSAPAQLQSDPDAEEFNAQEVADWVIFFLEDAEYPVELITTDLAGLMEGLTLEQYQEVELIVTSQQLNWSFSNANLTFDTVLTLAWQYANGYIDEAGLQAEMYETDPFTGETVNSFEGNYANVDFFASMSEARAAAEAGELDPAHEAAFDLVVAGNTYDFDDQRRVIAGDIIVLRLPTNYQFFSEGDSEASAVPGVITYAYTVRYNGEVVDELNSAMGLSIVDLTVDNTGSYEVMAFAEMDLGFSRRAVAWVYQFDAVTEEVFYQERTDEFLESNGETDFEGYTDTLDFRHQATGGFGSEDQSNENGAWLLSSGANPEHYDFGENSTASRNLTPNGFSEESVSLKWEFYVPAGLVDRYEGYERLPSEQTIGSLNMTVQSSGEYLGLDYATTLGTEAGRSFTFYGPGSYGIVAIGLDADGQPTGDEAVYIQSFMTDEQQAARENVETQIATAEEYSEGLDPASMTQIRVIFVPDQDRNAEYTDEGDVPLESQTFELPVYVGREEDTGHVVLIDLTPGMQMRIEKESGGLEAALLTWKDDRYESLPWGYLTYFVVENEQGFPELTEQFFTEGETWLEFISSWSGLGAMVSMGVGIVSYGLGFAATATGVGVVAAPALFAIGQGAMTLGAALTAVSATANIVDELDSPELDWGTIGVNMLTLAASLVGLRGAVSSGAVGLTNGGRLVYYSGLAIEGADTLVTVGTRAHAIMQIINDPRLTDDQKQQQIALAFGEILIAGGAFLISTQAMNQARSQAGDIWATTAEANPANSIGTGVDLPGPEALRQVASSLSDHQVIILNQLDQATVSAFARFPAEEIPGLIDIAGQNIPAANSLISAGEIVDPASFRRMSSVLGLLPQQALANPGAVGRNAEAVADIFTVFGDSPAAPRFLESTSALDALGLHGPATRNELLLDLAEHVDFLDLYLSDPNLPNAIARHKLGEAGGTLPEPDLSSLNGEAQTRAEYWVGRGSFLFNTGMGNGFEPVILDALAENFGAANVASSVHLWVKPRGEDGFMTVPDAIVLDGGGYRIIDGKFTSQADFDARGSLTSNQRRFLDLLLSPTNLESIEVRADSGRVENIGLSQGQNLSVGDITSFEVWASNPGEMSFNGNPVSLYGTASSPGSGGGTGSSNVE